MPWKGLRFGAVDNQKAKEGDSVVSVQSPRRSETVSRPLAQLLPRLSESASHPPDPEDRNASSPALPHNPQDQGKKRSRFNLMKLRHASDPQLSSSYKQGDEHSVPPVPPPPQIITTSPTISSAAQSNKRKSIFKPSNAALSSQQRRPSSAQHPTTENGLSPGTRDNPGAQRSHVSFEEPNRLSTTPFQNSGNRPQGNGQQSGAFSGTRLSESSRSDGSSVDPATGSATSKTSSSPISSSLFRLPRRKKDRNPLFPLPVKLPPPEHRNPDGKSPSNSKAPSVIQQQGSSAEVHKGNARTSIERGTPVSGPVPPALLRKNSTTSAQSGTSSPSVNASRSAACRGRSSTVGSLADIRDDPHQSSSELASSSRTSTNTGPRKSFSDLFHISHRLKTGESPRPGDNSPGSGAPDTPASIASKANSFSLQRELAVCPPRDPDDTPATYLAKLEEAVHRKAVATILSQSSEEFYTTALRKYIRKFSFFGDPMDMAIRKLLMEAELPKETQQIDRVLQAFANRYHECNPGIFASTDQAYFIAFSLLILHTDVFNKNNKRKMQKPDYVKNTKGEGVADDILECFYDNICYTPFIHVEDELNLGSRLPPKPLNFLKVTSSDHFPRASRDPVDPYAVILEGKLGSLRPNLQDVMELDDVYSTSGPGPFPNINRLHRAFYKPCVLQIVSARSRPDAFLTQSSIDNPAESQPGLVDIRVAKVGLLWRKDPKKKKTRSPWQEWGAVLTGSQLYFFRDVHWVKTLVSQYETHQKDGRRRPVTFTPPVVDFKPDATMSMADAVSLRDSSYKKHKHAFLLVRHGGFEEVFLANSDQDTDDWLASLNYAAAFRTTGVRMRGVIGINYEGQGSKRASRADSTASEDSERPSATDLVSPSSRIMDPQRVEEVFVARRELVSQRIREANDKLSTAHKELDEQLRNARHLQILTPVQPRARDQVILAAGKMSAKIKWSRLDIWRTKCHRDVLASDLLEEQKQLGITDLVDPNKTTMTADELAVSIPSHQLDMDLTPGGTSSKVDEDAPNVPPAHSPALSRRSRSIERLVESTSRDARRPSLKESVTQPEQNTPARKASLAGSKENSSLSTASDLPASVPRQTSVTSRQSNAEANLTTPVTTPYQDAASFIEDEEERVLRERGILPPEPTPPEDTPEKDKQDGNKDTNSHEHRSKVRRSFHRSLREAHIPHHTRNKKSKDQTSTTSGVEDGQATGTQPEGLSRSSPSFTVHGKKASVVTFGSEWQNMSPEQRLKQRKPMQSEDSRASETASTEEAPGSPRSTSAPGRPAQSVKSASVRTGISSRNQEPSQDQTSVPEVLEESRGAESETDKHADSGSVVSAKETHDTTSIGSPADDEITESGEAHPSKDDTHEPTVQNQEDLTEDSKPRSLSVSEEKKMNPVSPEQAVEA